MCSRPADAPLLKARSPEKDEIALIEKYKIFEYLNAFAGSLAHATGGPVSPWTPITDAGIIEDAELEAMGIDLSLVCPFKPVLIGYKTNSRSKLTTPLSAYALSHAVGDQGGKDAWKEQADKVKKVNKANKLADYVAFPRFVASRKVNAKGPLPSAKPVHMMASFKAEKFTLVMNAIKGTDSKWIEPRWTQLPCRLPPGSDDKYYDGGSPFKQIESGMLNSSGITYLRLDLHLRGESTPELSVLIRGAIVAEDERERRAWDFSKDSEKAFESLSEILSKAVLPEIVKAAEPSRPSEPRGHSPKNRRTRSRSPRRSETVDDGEKYRQRSKPSRHRRESRSSSRSPPRFTSRTERALSRRQRKIYGLDRHNL